MRPIHRLVDYLLPLNCLLCGTPVAGPPCICPGCRKDLPWLDRACPQCALPLPQRAPACGECLQRPPPFTRTLAAFTFAHPVDKLIQAYKYRRQLAAGTLLSELLAPRLSRAYRHDTLPQCLLPVPLHWRRLLQRGFNQAALLARHLGRELSLPVISGCRRQFHTAPQPGANRQQRRAKLRGAFALQHPLRQRHIALVDDVVTTTSTVSELAALLAAQGVGRIDVWCIARTA